jgi:hypothetical protein
MGPREENISVHVECTSRHDEIFSELHLPAKTPWSTSRIADTALDFWRSADPQLPCYREYLD